MPRVSVLCAGGYGAGRETIGQNGPNVLKESSFFNRELTHMHHKGKTAQNPILRPLVHRDSFSSLPAPATLLFVHMWKSGSRWLCERCLFFFSYFFLFLFFPLLSLLYFNFFPLRCHCRFTLPHLSLSWKEGREQQQGLGLKIGLYICVLVQL